MSLTELSYFWWIEKATTVAEVDRIIEDAESEGWHEPSSIHLRAEARKRRLCNLTRRLDERREREAPLYERLADS